MALSNHSTSATTRTNNRQKAPPLPDLEAMRAAVKAADEARKAAWIAEQQAEKQRRKAAEVVQLELHGEAGPTTLGDALHDALAGANERSAADLAAQHARTQAAELAVLRAALRADFVERFSGQSGAVDPLDLIRVVGAMEGRARAAARFDGAMREGGAK